MREENPTSLFKKPVEYGKGLVRRPGNNCIAHSWSLTISHFGSEALEPEISAHSLSYEDCCPAGGLVNMSTIEQVVVGGSVPSDVPNPTSSAYPQVPSHPADNLFTDNCSFADPSSDTFDTTPISYTITPKPKQEMFTFDEYEDHPAWEHECNHIIVKGRIHRKCKNKAKLVSNDDFLPTCTIPSHRRKEVRAGHCRYVSEDATRCDRLIRWSPPFLELCPDHRMAVSGDVNSPMEKIPTEVRVEIFSYFLPGRVITSSSRGPDLTELHNLMQVNKLFCNEIKAHLYTKLNFAVDIRERGIYMCRRWLNYSLGEDGQVSARCGTFKTAEVDAAKARFMKNFQFKNIRTLTFNILMINDTSPSWDVEVETYDLRDKVAHTVNTILKDCTNLNWLTVKICFGDFPTTETAAFEQRAKLITEPFMALRGVLKANTLEIWMHINYTASLRYIATQTIYASNGTHFQLPSPFPNDGPPCSMPGITKAEQHVQTSWSETTKAHFATWLQVIQSNGPVAARPAIKDHFLHFKNVYAQMIAQWDGMKLAGRMSYLHRARVAREAGDMEEFTKIQGEAITQWFQYSERKENLYRDKLRGLSTTTAAACGLLDRSIVQDQVSPGAKVGAAGTSKFILIPVHTYSWERCIFFTGGFFLM
jgi:hypothetical protein